MNRISPETRWVVLLAIAGFLFCLWVPSENIDTGITSNYLAIHTILEFVTILVSFGIFTVGWATFRNVQTPEVLILSIASFAVGWLDLGHALSFSGMPDFVTASSPDKAIDFWLGGRLVGSLALLAVALVPRARITNPNLFRNYLILASIFTLAAYGVILFDGAILPAMFIEGEGLTPIKLILEGSTATFSLVSAYLFFRPQAHDRFVSYSWLGTACIVFALGSCFFLRYKNFDDLFTFVGHIYKMVAYIILYRAVFIECVTRPFADVSDLAKRASEASESKTRFLANVSHEFRTPLGIISGFSDLISDAKDADPQIVEWADLITRNARQLRTMIDDLLDLAKVETDHITVSSLPFQPVIVIRNVINEFAVTAQAKNLVLSYEGPGDELRFIYSDQLRFRQILVNLLANAIKFTDRGEVKVIYDCTSESLFQLSVVDSGIGIDPVQAERLFKPFSQVDDAFDRKSGGTGLGLALSKRLAELMGGTLILEQSAPGLGSRFTLTLVSRPPEREHALPVIAAQSSLVAPAPTASRSFQFQSRRILIAEDIEDNRKLLERYFESTAALLVFATNGHEAVRHAENSPFDLILMDIQMPEMDGFTAANHLKNSNLQVPIIALSAHAHSSERERALGAGFSDYLVKPITRKELLERVQPYLI